jgi:hypothetical protein
MVKLISEKLAVATYTYPFAEEKKDIFYSYIKSLPRGRFNPLPEEDQNNVLITRRHLYKEEILHPLLQWITQILHRDFITRYVSSEYQVHSSHEIKCNEMWGVTYQKGSFLGPHTHSPAMYTFSYNLNIPKNSPPLIFSNSGYRVKSKEGQLIIFESRLSHRVPLCKVNNRCVIAGSFGK